MVRLQYPSVKFFMVRSPNKSGFPACFKRAGDGMRRGGECRPAAPSSSPHASALGGGFIPPPLSCLGVGFWYKFVPSSNGRLGRNAHPPSPQKPVKNASVLPHRPALLLQNISPKNFWKGDDICHIFCVIIEAKEDTHARNQSL